MKNYFRFIYISIAALLILFSGTSCKGTKGAGTSTKLKKKSVTFLMNQMADNRKDAEWLSGKVQVNYSDDNQRIKVLSYIRMRKDSVIWMNVKKLGIEAARIQITPDSIFLINRLQRQYLAKPIAEGVNALKLPKTIAENLNFKSLQDMLLGNPVILPVIKMEVAIEDGKYHLAGEYDSVQSEYWLNNKPYNLAGVNYVDIYQKKMLKLNYDDYRTTETLGDFSYDRNFFLDTEETGEVNVKLEILELEIDSPTKILFSIPPSYIEMK